MKKAPAAAATAPGLTRKDCFERRPSTLATFREQALAIRHGLPISTARMMAPLALGGARG